MATSMSGHDNFDLRYTRLTCAICQPGYIGCKMVNYMVNICTRKIYGNVNTHNEKKNLHEPVNIKHNYCLWIIIDQSDSHIVNRSQTRPQRGVRNQGAFIVRQPQLGRMGGVGP